MTRKLSGSAKKLLCYLILAGSSLAHAGSYEDFFRAVRQDNHTKIRELLNRGFDANTPDPKGKNGLGIALSEGDCSALLNFRPRGLCQT